MYLHVLNEIITFFQFHLENQFLKYNLNKWSKMAQERTVKYLPFFRCKFVQLLSLCYCGSVSTSLGTCWWKQAFVVQGKSSPQVSLSCSVLLQLHLLACCLFDFPGACRAHTCWGQGLGKNLHPQPPNSLSPAAVPGSSALCHHFCKLLLLLELVFHLLKNSHIHYLTLCRVILIRRNWSTFPVVKIFSTVEY